MHLLVASVQNAGRHGAVVNVILIVLGALVVGAVLVGAARSRKRSSRRSERDRGRET